MTLNLEREKMYESSHKVPKCDPFWKARKWFKVACYSRINFLELKRNYLINKITDNNYLKSQQYVTFYWKYDVQNIILITFNKSLQRIWTQDLWFTRPMPLEYHWAMIIYNQFDRYKQLYKNYLNCRIVT